MGLSKNTVADIVKRHRDQGGSDRLTATLHLVTRMLGRGLLQDDFGRHWPIRYRDLARPAITLWEHRAAVKDLRARGRSSGG